MSQSPLISNVVVNDAEKEALGLLEMAADRRGCSASLLTNCWVLSAVALHGRAGPCARLTTSS